MSKNKPDLPFKSLQHRIEHHYNADGDMTWTSESYVLVTERGSIEARLASAPGEYAMYGGVVEAFDKTRPQSALDMDGCPVRAVNKTKPQSADDEPDEAHPPVVGRAGEQLLWDGTIYTGVDEFAPFLGSPRAMLLILTDWAEYCFGRDVKIAA